MLGALEEGFEGSNEREAFSLYELAAEYGYSKAITNLGICYLKGIYVEKDPIAARKVKIIYSKLKNLLPCYRKIKQKNTFQSNQSFLKKRQKKKNPTLYSIWHISN